MGTERIPGPCQVPGNLGYFARKVNLKFSELAIACPFSAAGSHFHRFRASITLASTSWLPELRTIRSLWDPSAAISTETSTEFVTPDPIIELSTFGSKV